MRISYYFISGSILLVASCSGIESFQKKMERYSARSTDAITVPEIKAPNISFSPITAKSKRGPASIVQSSEAITNKKLYFLSLYAQYESLKNITNNSNASSLSLCPSFHTGLVTYQEKHQAPVPSFEKKYSYDQAELNNEKYINNHPELFLPVEKAGVTPRVIDIYRGMKGQISSSAASEIMQNAVNIHLAKTYTELRELCDYGASSNYYIYENLITHIKNTSFKASTDNMNILLKTTLFSNRALITSLGKDKPVSTGRSIASEKSNVPYTEDVVARLNVPWSNEYYSFLKNTK